MNTIFLTYARIYKAVIKISFAKISAYTANFYSEIFSAFVFTGLHLITILLLTSKVNTVFGWTRGEMIVLTIVFNLERALLEVFFYGGLGKMAEIIFKGELDGILLKPVNSQFLLSTYEFRFPAIVRILISIALLVYFIDYYNLPVTLINAVVFVILSITSLILLYSLWFIFTTVLIWNPVLTNMKDLLAYMTGLLRYPPEVFKGLGFVAFSVILPFLFVVAPATLALLGKLHWWEIIFCILLSGFFLYCSRLFWAFALRHYTSASS